MNTLVLAEAQAVDLSSVFTTLMAISARSSPLPFRPSPVPLA